MKIQVDVFWVVAPYSVVVEYHSIRRPFIWRRNIFLWGSSFSKHNRTHGQVGILSFAQFNFSMLWNQT